jgi:hypothetical protein
MEGGAEDNIYAKVNLFAKLTFAIMTIFEFIAIKYGQEFGRRKNQTAQEAT